MFYIYLFDVISKVKIFINTILAQLVGHHDSCPVGKPFAAFVEVFCAVISLASGNRIAFVISLMRPSTDKAIKHDFFIYRDLIAQCSSENQPKTLLILIGIDIVPLLKVIGRSTDMPSEIEAVVFCTKMMTVFNNRQNKLSWFSLNGFPRRPHDVKLNGRKLSHPFFNSNVR